MNTQSSNPFVLEGDQREYPIEQETTTISMPLPLGMGKVNCYLIKNLKGFFLIDTGIASGEELLLDALAKAGCKPGNLKLLILTHGDYDHIGNVVTLREKFDVKVAMHPEDAAMAKSGDMFINRKKPNVIFKLLGPLFVRFDKSKRFSPDILLKDGDDLRPYGLNAKVISIPGHSKGSIGILFDTQDFFCGDLLDNSKEPGFTSLMDDQIAANNSMMRLQTEDIDTVYPGHGDPFPFSVFKPKN
ncbi:MAG TPA: MBL fold metallo-hydrolase [Anaerolineaceae bacterium]|nr:MBL fold metallo-hydrolase [Anaerolineaceae bacterium]